MLGLIPKDPENTFLEEVEAAFQKIYKPYLFVQNQFLFVQQKEARLLQETYLEGIEVLFFT